MSQPPTAPPLALTMGEPAGIGGELVLEAWLKREEAALPPFFAIDDPERLAALARSLGLALAIETITDPGEAAHIFPRALPVLAEPLPRAVRPGQPDPANGPAVIASIRRAAAFALAGRAGGVVTSPIHKKSLYDAGFSYPGHTEFLASLVEGAPVPVMMLVIPTLRVIPVTIHLPLAAALAALSSAQIVHCGKVAAAALAASFGIAQPALAVAALNPHAGEAASAARRSRPLDLPSRRCARRA